MEGTNRFGENWYAYLVKPLDYEDGRKYPLVVTTYRSGDYFLRGASGDENPIQVYAAKGFAVLTFDVGWHEIFDQEISLPNCSIGLRRSLRSRTRCRDWWTRGSSILPALGLAGYSHGEEIGGYAVTHSHLFRAASGADIYDPCFYALGGEGWHELFTKWGLAGLDRGRDESALAGNRSFPKCRQSQHGNPPKHDGYGLPRLYGHLPRTKGFGQTD